MNLFTAITGFLALSCNVVLAQSSTSYLSVSQNPFATFTELTIHGHANSQISLYVSDSQGVIADFLIDSKILSGDTTVTFWANSLPDGIYYASLIANNEGFITKLYKDQTLSFENPYLTSEKSSFRIFPNPAFNELTLEAGFEIASIRIYDVTGRQVLATKLYGNEHVYIGFLGSGLYQLVAEGEKGLVTKKFLKK